MIVAMARQERIDFLTYLNANDPGFRVAGVVVSAQGVQKILAVYMMLVIYLFTLQVRRRHGVARCLLRGRLHASLESCLDRCCLQCRGRTNNVWPDGVFECPDECHERDRYAPV